MDSRALEILEEKVVELISRLARIQEENTRLKDRVLTLEKELENKEEALRNLSHQRETIQVKIDSLIRRIEEYQEVLSQDLDLGEEEHGQG
jgi:chromosome segregation ATPase